jgi:hypothetical protein
VKVEIKRSSKTFVVSAELGMLAGIIIAFYLIPATTTALTFWGIAIAFVAILNCMLFIRLKE